MRLARAYLAAAAIALAGPAVGCTTEAFCFDNCLDPFGLEGDAGGGDSNTDANLGLDVKQPDGFVLDLDGSKGEAGCSQTNGGTEVCDGLDNDCDGTIDNNIDFEKPQHCGNCFTDCTATTGNVDQPTCTPPAAQNLGIEPGTCDYVNCAQDFYDRDGNRENGCEYYCPFNPAGTNTMDLGGAEGCGRDDDCDTVIDEDVDVCSDVGNCGKCGKPCVILNGTGKCESTASGSACNESNTTCSVDTCDAGWYDADGSPDNGCEYQCPVAVPSPEICDGIDNDCDGRIDNKDLDLVASDPDVGDACFGGTTGQCVAPSHEGVKKCIAGAIRCCDKDSGATGAALRNGTCDGAVPPFVLRPGDLQEICNGRDDDCDGALDDAPIDQGGVCGSSVGNCQTGTLLCVAGALQCAGQTGPASELCDGQDNDCDGVLDGTAPAAAVACSSDADCASRAPALACLPKSSNPLDKVCAVPPTDVAGASGYRVCDQPPPAPSGATQPCRAGTMACLGGVPLCQGSVTPQQGTDECFDDTNCDGQLTNQSGRTDDDPLNCGTCGNDCNALAGGVLWTCDNGSCVPNGCQAGFIDCDTNANDCETACTFTSSIEACNGLDDDCDCQIDENVPPKTPIQACGVSPAATEPGCTSGVTVACVAGAFRCTFPPNYCAGGNPAACSTTVDVCDGRDNDCNGVSDQNFKPPILNQGFLGQTCFSDDGLPAPGHGNCRTTGIFTCNSAGTGTTCPATIDMTRALPETCNGVDDDCDGLIDAADPGLPTSDTRVGQQCFGGTQGVCALPANAGTTQCQGGSVVCVGANLVRPGDRPETCNGADDDCDGAVDESPIDAGGVCGSGVGGCRTGNQVCVSGALVCQGQVGPSPETCNGVDDNCDGTIDNNPSGVGQPCNVPPPPPAPPAQCTSGVSQPCAAGTTACVGATLVCNGSTPAPSLTDNCCEDTNCDGQLTNQPNLLTDVRNCGTCGNDCAALAPGGHGIWSCVSGACVRSGCEAGFYNCDSNPNDCEYSCNFSSSTELCNGVDDDCNCVADDVNPANTPTASQVCGTSPGATDCNCLRTGSPGCGAGTGVAISCTAGAWRCTFPSDYCDGGSPATCATTADTCDGKDNNCNGAADENYRQPVKPSGYLGQPCNSDDGLPPPGHGACKRSGQFVCTANELNTVCNAVIGSCASNPGGCTELCDGTDNDCDGLVDETYLAKGTDAANFVRPAVVRTGTNLWVMQYEASRTSATINNPGSGNGYHYATGQTPPGIPAAPAGQPLERTRACSAPTVVPWFNLTPIEAMQSCAERGGRVCTTAEWRSVCEATVPCTRGYNPRGAACTSNQAAGKFCNIHAYDFSTAPGIQDGLLPTAWAGPTPQALQNCWTDWGGLQGNLAGQGRVYDTSGNLREITNAGGNLYKLMGGAYNTVSEDGMACGFEFFTVDQNFRIYDTGFRCCYGVNPTI